MHPRVVAHARQPFGHTLESSRLADISVVAKCPTTLCSRCGTAWCVCSWTIKTKSRGEAPHLSPRRAHFSPGGPRRSISASPKVTGGSAHGNQEAALPGVADRVIPDAGATVDAFRSRGRPRLVGAMPAASSARLSLRVPPPVDSRALISEAT